MAEAKVKLPDGRTAIVRGPTREAVLKRVDVLRQEAAQPVPESAPEEESTLQQLESAFQKIPGAPALSELAAAANRSLTGLVDFLGPDAVNAVLDLAGSESRVPTLTGTAGEIGVGDGGYMEEGLARDVVRAGGETAPIALGAGQLFRTIASKLPASSQSAFSNVMRQLGGSTPGADVAAGALSGAGAEIGEEVGGAPGQAIGAVVAPVGGALAGQAAARAASSGRSALRRAAPTIDALKARAKEVYQQIDDLGVTIDSQRLGSLADDIVQTIRNSGFNAKIHPKVSAAMDEIVAQTDRPLSIGEIDVLRRVAQSAARSTEPDERRLGSMMIDKMDDFLDDLPRGAINNPSERNVGPLIREARELWSRAKKSELIETAFERARNQASGLENGLRVQFRSLLNNQKAMRGFTQEEKDAMRQVVRGGGLENISKALGKFGFSEGQASSMLLSSLGIAGGAAVGGAPGAVAIPVIGQGFKKAAQTLTRRNAELANALVRSGRNGLAIANAYKRNVPKAEQSVEELSGLLLRRNANLERMAKSEDRMIANAALLASLIKNAPDTESEPRSEEPSQ